MIVDSRVLIVVIHTARFVGLFGTELRGQDGDPDRQSHSFHEDAIHDLGPGVVRSDATEEKEHRGGDDETESEFLDRVIMTSPKEASLRSQA